MACGEAEDPGGLTPVKDDNEAARHFIRRTLLILDCVDYTYHAGLRELGWGYVLNFLISVVPMGFLTTWVYVKNSRSMLACIIFHLFVNTMQEKIAMTPRTKCLETIVVTLAAVLVVMTNRGMFFEKDHIGNLLSYNGKS